MNTILNQLSTLSNQWIYLLVFTIAIVLKVYRSENIGDINKITAAFYIAIAALLLPSFAGLFMNMGYNDYSNLVKENNSSSTGLLNAMNSLNTKYQIISIISQLMTGLSLILLWLGIKISPSSKSIKPEPKEEILNN